MVKPVIRPFGGHAMAHRAYLFAGMAMSAVLLFAGLLLPEAALAVSSESVAVVRVSGFGSTDIADVDSNPSGLTSSALAVGTGNTSGSQASADTGPGTMGVAATAAPNTPGARASASMDDLWNCSGSCTGSALINLVVRFDGVLDPLFVDPTLPEVAIFMDIVLRYTADDGNMEFVFSAGYDAGDPEITASFRSGITTQDVTDELVFNGNAVSFNATFASSVPAGAWVDIFSASVDVNPFQDDLPGTHTIDFASTFSTHPVSLDPAIMFVSDGGRLSNPAAVPEPATFVMVLASAVAAIVVREGLKSRR
jgi:hypothetical protein